MTGVSHSDEERRQLLRSDARGWRDGAQHRVGDPELAGSASPSPWGRRSSQISSSARRCAGGESHGPTLTDAAGLSRASTARATITAPPPTLTRSIASATPSARLQDERAGRSPPPGGSGSARRSRSARGGPDGRPTVPPRSRGRVLRDPERGAEHARLDPRPLGGEAAHAEPPRPRAPAGRGERGHLVLVDQRHHHVARAVVVDLDGELGVLHAQRGQQLGGLLERLRPRDRLLHLPVADRAPPPGAGDRDQSGPGLQTNLRLRPRSPSTNAVPSTGWPANGSSVAG